MKLIATALILGSAIFAATLAAQKQAPVVEVVKSPTCGCCSKWVDHMRENGFTVRVTEKSDSELEQFKTQHGVPGTIRSCHTALVGGYVVEGHVPATEITRLLQKKPAIAGIAVGGMPVGSPGMEVPGQRPHAYNVVSFDKKGAVAVVAKYNQ